MPVPVGPIAQAIAEVAKVIGNWQVSSERRRMRAALDSAEKYIFVNEKSGQFAELTEPKQKQLLAHFRKRFFAYNE
jgi:hypothetical protein